MYNVYVFTLLFKTVHMCVCKGQLVWCGGLCYMWV